MAATGCSARAERAAFASSGKHSGPKSRPAVRRLLAAWLVASTPALADTAPACHGEDLLARMASDAPADYARIENEARTLPFGEGRLFRITRAGLKPSFLLGTIHIADPRVADLSPGTRAALAQSASAAVEALDGDRQVATAQTRRAIAAPDAFRASQLLPPVDYSRLKLSSPLAAFPYRLRVASRLSRSR